MSGTSLQDLPSCSRAPALSLAVFGLSMALAVTLGVDAGEGVSESPRRLVVEREGGFSLERVRANELHGGGSDLALRLGLRPRGGGAFRTPSLNTMVFRDLPHLWSLEVQGGEKPRDLRVMTELRSPTGEENQLSHERHPELLLPVRVEERLPRWVEDARGRAHLEGGARLTLDLSTITSAGRYRGTLTITVIDL